MLFKAMYECGKGKSIDKNNHFLLSNIAENEHTP